MQPTVLIVLFLLLHNCCWGQQLILAHRPFADSNTPNWRYSKDTVLFDSNSDILGLVYFPQASQEQPQLEVLVQNNQGKKAIASFSLKRFHPNTLNWHASIQKWQQQLLNSPYWYLFEISPNLMVTDAYNGVAFLELLQDAAQQHRPITLTYNLLGKDKTNSCVLNFAAGEGQFAPLFSKLEYYQTILANKTSLERQQDKLVEQCQPYSFAQIQEWATQSLGLRKDLNTSDLNLFKAVEHLKIVTESIPNSISPYLKRELRALLLMDIALLEMPEGSDKTKKIRQKEALLQQLSLYPELHHILSQYHQKTRPIATHKQTEQQQQKALQEVSKKYRPYQSIYQAHQKLEEELTSLKLQLEAFN